ncbi:MAG: DUF4258 domain-containing protein [Candidatus Kapabacteria bacterium]|jgi:hypothetical protein|nr:DUF4258 domain-containing protein [Candidatus Kapabacteria bacterium]
MTIRFTKHCLQRLSERGVSEEEVWQTVLRNQSYLAPDEKLIFHAVFPFNALWRDIYYANKRIECICDYNAALDECTIITVVSKYF